MITGISIRNFRSFCTLGPHFPLSAFSVLVGPNGSGKSTFLDAIEFVKDCLVLGPTEAVESRVPDFRDLTRMRRGGRVEIVLRIDDALAESGRRTLYYWLSIQGDQRLGLRVEIESLLTGPAEDPEPLVARTEEGKCAYRDERNDSVNEFTFSPDRLALAFVPPDEERYPTANAAKKLLTQGIRFMQLNSRAMRQPCPATRPTDLELDGSNLARVVGRLLGKNGSAKERTEAEASAMQRWVEHLRYALPDLDSIGWGRREPDNAEYITLKYKDGLVCPSWLVSDGTLRMLALTLLAFLPPAPGIYLIEEPENGVHPKALEIIMRSLSSVPSAQVFIATHSPLVVQLAGRDSLLCFQKDEEGTHITHGADHPRLREWDGVPDLATVFACGILE